VYPHSADAFLHVHQTDTNRLNVQSLTGLFYMLLLAVGIGLCIAAIERIVSASPRIGHQWNRLWRSGMLGLSCATLRYVLCFSSHRSS
jgi:hypothetical protein